MSTYRSRAADMRAADDVSASSDLMCAADGCPHRWSVDAGAGRLCSFHAWSPSRLWPQITQERLHAQAERALRAQMPVEPAPSMSFAEKRAALIALRDTLTTPHKAGRTTWARDIVARVDAGEVVSPLVVRMARDVVGKLKARKETA